MARAPSVSDALMARGGKAKSTDQASGKDVPPSSKKIPAKSKSKLPKTGLARYTSQIK